MNTVKLIYDLASCPDHLGLSMEEVLRIYKEHGIVLYDSVGQDPDVKVNEPRLFNVPEGTEIYIADLSTEEGFKKYQELIEV
jgi:hypothetical protein